MTSHSLIALGYLITLAAIGCAAGAPQRQSPAERARQPATSTALHQPPAASHGSEHAAAGQGSERTTGPSAARRTFECGRSRCLVGEESCCRSDGMLGVCVPNAPPDPPDVGQLLASQIEACDNAIQGNLHEIARCGGTSDCSQGQACCDEFLYSGAAAVICKPTEPHQVSCSYAEICSVDRECSIPGAVCVNGKCRRAAVIDCSGSRCDLRTHTCHVGEPDQGSPQCTSNDRLTAWQTQGRPIFDVQCMQHSDCLPGELCHLALGRSFCQIAMDGMSAVVCSADADCPADFCEFMYPGRKPKCVNEPDLWHSVCMCP